MISIDLLGSMRVMRNGVDRTPSPPKLRRVFALLALNANSLVSVDQMFDELWGDRLPTSALTTLQTYIYQLRRRLDLANAPGRCPVSEPDATVPAPMLLTGECGYELRLSDLSVVDTHRFDQLAVQGRAAVTAGHLQNGVDGLRAALAFWRGTPLLDVGAGRRLEPRVIQLEERHKCSLELLFATELELGNHHAVLDELFVAHKTHPLHEGFTSHLMVALHRCGRRTDALHVARAVRNQLVEELGLEPSSGLQRLHQAILADDPELAHPGHRQLQGDDVVHVVPAQLPPDVPLFVGRAEEIATIEKHLLTSPGRLGAGARLVELYGAPGVGKSTLANHVAHRVRGQFPDGQLFVELTGPYDDRRMAGVLRSCLRTCGVWGADIPTDVSELSRLFRKWSSDRRLLVVVDDVLDPVQLGQLMPGPGCALLATNRSRTNVSSSGHAIILFPMSPEDSLRLFKSVVSDHRPCEEPESVTELLEMCEQLPLAVRAVADRLRGRPEWTITRLLRRLRRDTSALFEMPGARDLQASLHTNFDNLSDYRRAALTRIADVGQSNRVDEVATLLATDRSEAETLLEYLVDAHFVEERGDDGVAVPHGADPSVYRIPTLTWLALRNFATVGAVYATAVGA